MDDWIKIATEMFYKYQKEAKEAGITELKLINASKAFSLSELLEKFGHMPDVEGK